MLNVFKALNKMRNFKTKPINEINEIDDVFNHTMSPKKQMKIEEQVSKIELNEHSMLEKKAHFYDDDDLEEMRVFNEIKKHYKIFDLVKSGDTANIEYIISIFKNDPECLKEKPDKSKMIVNKLDNNGKSLLYISSIYGNINMVKVLVEYGADIYYRCKVKL